MTVRNALGFLAGASAAALALAATSAKAQSADGPQPDSAEESTSSDPDAIDDSEIVVTGTNLRGIAPVGTNVVSMSRESITATGATSANDLLTHIPQVTSAFLSTPTTSAGDTGLSLIRPNIRNLGASGTNTTLVLVDGHRLVGAGILQSTADPDLIPPAVLERLDVVPDGGSSIYGSDAIGGVINFISRRRFDGFEAAGHYGFADNYHTRDVNLTAGKDWGSGSGYISYVWAHNDAIFGRDRDFMRQIGPNQGYCSPGTIFANGTTYALPGRTPGTMTSCDNTDDNSFWPRVTRKTVFGSFNQEITPSITIELKGYYSRRSLTHFLDLAAISPQTLTITNANPFFSPIGTETRQDIRTSFAGVIDNRTRNSLDSYGISPTVSVDLGGGWQMRALGNYGHSRTKVEFVAIDGGSLATALASTNAATALNPYVLGSNSPAVVSGLTRHSYAAAAQELRNGRLVVDGPLFGLPGGDARLAVGAEYIRETHQARNGTVAFGQENTLPLVKLGRNIKAAFGEVALPFIGADNETSWARSLTLSFSARYDDYSDQGGTFNPKVGVTYEPTDWLKVRGNWGTSFNAPSVIDATGNFAVGGLPVNFFVPGQQAPWSVILAGNRGREERPQTAHTWSLGVDIRPAAVSGLNLSATYYNLHLKDVIGLLLGQNIAFTPATAPFLKDNVPCADALAQYGSAQSFLVPLSTVCALTPTVSVLDFRVQNLGIIKQDGIDFDLNFTRPVSFGSVHAGLAGTYTLHRKVAIVPGAPFTEQLDTPGRSRVAFVASAGAQFGNLAASASVNHAGGYDLNPVVSTPLLGTQKSVDGFTTVDLFLEYKLPRDLLKDTSLTLNVANLFDVDPPFFNGCIGTVICGYTNGSTLGRLITFGVRTKF